MSSHPIPLPLAAKQSGAVLSAPLVARLVEITPEGSLVVETDGGTRFSCAWLQVSATPVLLHRGDAVLVMPLCEGAPPVVMGRIANYREGTKLPSILQIAAEQDLSLRCGAASIDLRADGKVMIRGEDVLVRAKGTKRIRAGTVSIN